jgi:hypothetical protein
MYTCRIMWDRNEDYCCANCYEILLRNVVVINIERLYICRIFGTLCWIIIIIIGISLCQIMCKNSSSLFNVEVRIIVL